MHELPVSESEGETSACSEPDDFIVLDEFEAMVLSETLALLRALRSPEAERLSVRFGDLEALGTAVARFPPVRAIQTLGNVRRSVETLESALCLKCGSARLLHTPSRVVIGRSFLIAKIHAFSYAAKAVSFDAPLVSRLRGCILGVVFSLLAEDVYTAALDDDAYPAEKKSPLAADLIRLWDDRRDPRACAHIPALSELWAARDGHIPVYGTMEGASELARLSFDMSESWFAFVSERLRDSQTHFALEEYLFGLSYEEIRWVRTRMASQGLHSADYLEIRSMLGSKTAFSPVDGNDPRAMYDFYAERRDAARARAWSGVPGPRRTIEELYLSFLIAR